MSQGDNNDVMERLVEELEYQIPFKETTDVGDTVIMLRENDDGRVSMVYAKVLSFERDTSKRDEWWHVHFVFLEVPPLPRTIILQTPHFTGDEIFTMGGRKVFIKAINFNAYEDEEPISLPKPKPRRKKPPEGGGDGPPEPPQKPGKPTFTLIK